MLVAGPTIRRPKTFLRLLTVGRPQPSSLFSYLSMISRRKPLTLQSCRHDGVAIKREPLLRSFSGHRVPRQDHPWDLDGQMHGLRKSLPLRFFRLVLEPDISLRRVFNLSIFRSICTTKCSLRAWATITMSSGTSPAKKCLIFTVGRLCWLDRLSRCISPDGRWLEHLHSSERMPRLSTYPLSVDVGYCD